MAMNRPRARRALAAGILNICVVPGTALPTSTQVVTNDRGAASLIITTDADNRIVNVQHGTDGTKLGKHYVIGEFTLKTIVDAANERGYGAVCDLIFG